MEFGASRLPCWRLVQIQLELQLYREKYDMQTQMLTDYEMEIEMLRKQLQNLENEKEKDKKTIAQLEELLKDTRVVSQSWTNK